MPELANENKNQLNKKTNLKKELNKNSKLLKSDDNLEDKNPKLSISNKEENDNSLNENNVSILNKNEESIIQKAIREAKEKIKKEEKETLKARESKKDNKNLEFEEFESKEKVEIEKDKIIANKEESVIQKIKNFIAKIVLMQEEARKESESKKALKEKGEEKNKDKSEEKELSKKSKYMLEYYDLPYRYNETVVKILAQTPKRLFVYWDISDNDINKYKEAFGDDFFEDTYPILLVHNEEKDYTFEVPINDFANSWYLDINDPKSKYVIQLGRKFKTNPKYVNIASTEKTKDVELHNDYVPITTSNILEVPNDHILFEKIEEKALYRNVKTNEESYVDIANSEFLNRMGKIYSIYDLYKEIYKDEIGEGDLIDLLNPSSMSSSGVKSSIFR